MAKTKSQRTIEIDKKIEEALAALSLNSFSNIYQTIKHFNISYNTLEYQFIKDK